MHQHSNLSPCASEPTVSFGSGGEHATGNLHVIADPPNGDVTRSMRLRTLRFFAGASPSDGPLMVSPGTVLLIVGPNNSGKSLSLREIERWCRNDDNPRSVIDEIEVELPTTSESANALQRFSAQLIVSDQEGQVPGRDQLTRAPLY